jgi:peroxiredoxin
MIKAWIFPAAFALACAGAAAAPAALGQTAPAFQATDSTGKRVSLADFKGKTVVLEWVNPSCPYVRKHYDSGHMQSTQKAATAQGVVWLAINSTHAGHDEYRKPSEMAAWMLSRKAAATHTLIDADGKVGRAYGARTTPHLYIVDAQGRLAYAGAIDDRPSANPADVQGAKNFVGAALADLAAGRPVAQPSTRAYGCSVKYGEG